MTLVALLALAIPLVFACALWSMARREVDGARLSLGQLVHYTVLARGPIVVAATLVAGPVWMLDSNLVGNLLELESFVAVLGVGFAAGLTAQTAAMTLALILRYSFATTSAPELRPVVTMAPAGAASPGQAAWATLLTLPVWSCLGGLHPAASFAAFAIGALAAAALLIGAQRLRRRRRRWQPGHGEVLRTPSRFAGYFERVDGPVRPAPPRWVLPTLVLLSVAALGCCMLGLPARLGGGWSGLANAGLLALLGITAIRFLHAVEARRQVRLLPGHHAAIYAAVLLAAIHLSMQSLLDAASPRFDGFPVLAALLFLLTLLGCLYAGAAFFLDRYRVPSLGALVLASFVGGMVSGSTHYFPVREIPAPVERSTVAASIEGQTTHVLVCAEGGGIRAAAWTARVLTGLDAALGEAFTGRLRLLSGASGGSVGEMFFVEQLRRTNGALGETDRLAVWQAGHASSLSQVGLALVFRDLTRITGLGIDLENDRGRALEQVFARSLGNTAIDTTLGAWCADARAGRIPHVAFQATVGGMGGDDPRRGRRFLFTTLSMPTAAQDFFAVLPGHDIAVPTAARMSATFPWVTPMARAAVFDADGGPPAPLAQPAYYLADGGYFDNYGIVSAVEWVRELCRLGGSHRVVLVQILSAPHASREVPDDAERRGASAWGTAALGPIDLLLGTWAAGQDERRRIQMGVLDDLLDGPRVSGENEAPTGVDFCLVEIALDPSLVRGEGPAIDAAPLSWHLTASQIEGIDATWRAQRDRVIAELGEALRDR